MSETSARNTFREKVIAQFPMAHYQRFEDRFRAGIPDINIYIPGNGEWWVEAKHLKALPVWKNTPVRVEIRREQVMWLRNRKKAGGNCMVVVRIGLAEWVAFDDHFEGLEEGLVTESFFQLARWRGKKLDISAIFS